MNRNVEVRLEALRGRLLDGLQAVEDLKRDWPGGTLSVAGASMMAALGTAMVRQEPVRIAYRDEAGRETERAIVPDGIFKTRRGEWHVTGLCLLRGDKRTFTLHRIIRVGEAGGPGGGWARDAALSGVAGPVAQRAAREGYEVDEAVVRGLVGGLLPVPDALWGPGEEMGVEVEDRRSPTAAAFELRDRLLAVPAPAGVPWRVARVESVGGREAVRVLVGEAGCEVSAVYYPGAGG